MKKVRCSGCGKTTRLLDDLCWECVARIESERKAREAYSERQRSQPTQEAG